MCNRTEWSAIAVILDPQADAISTGQRYFNQNGRLLIHVSLNLDVEPLKITCGEFVNR